MRDFSDDKAFEGHDKIMNRYLKPDLLILDDMGMKHLPKRSGEFLFEIIMRRHELRSTMMTSNRPLEDWGKLIGDVPSATAILDWFLSDAEVIRITGDSYRLRGRRADIVALQHRDDVVTLDVRLVGRVLARAAEPPDRRVLVPERFQERVRKLRRIKRGLDQLADCLLNFNCVQASDPWCKLVGENI